MELERLSKHPGKWWKMVKRLKVVDKEGDRMAVSKVVDAEGSVRTWRGQYQSRRNMQFDEVLNA